MKITRDNVGQYKQFIVGGNASENRGNLQLWDELREQAPASIITLELDGRESVTVHAGNGSSSRFSLKDDVGLSTIFSTKDLLIDISGMSNQMWPSLLRAANKQNISPSVLYAEPESYKQHSTPASDNIFDLTRSFEGLSPLPGFVKLGEPENDTKTILVALLGFEGNRSTRLALQIEPKPKVIPIVGLPGFQIEFPEYTIACNREVLRLYESNGNVRYARASCPFEAYSVLSEIKKDHPDAYMYLAPVGTKPHSLGAVWFAIKNPGSTELLYDYPVRKPGRTDGIGVVHIYDFGDPDAF